jgi:hypothetical protein
VLHHGPVTIAAHDNANQGFAHPASSESRKSALFYYGKRLQVHCLTGFSPEQAAHKFTTLVQRQFSEAQLCLFVTKLKYSGDSNAARAGIVLPQASKIIHIFGVNRLFSDTLC